jgi:hypothetical protein
MMGHVNDSTWMDFPGSADDTTPWKVIGPNAGTSEVRLSSKLQPARRGQGAVFPLWLKVSVKNTSKDEVKVPSGFPSPSTAGVTVSVPVEDVPGVKSTKASKNEPPMLTGAVV